MSSIEPTGIPDYLPGTSMTLTQARSRLSGLHFAKEALSAFEREILYIAEALLRHIDIETGLSPAQQEMRTLAMQPGVHEVNLYDDGVEFCGVPGDLDGQAGFISGEFTISQVREAIGNSMPLTRTRT